MRSYGTLIYKEVVKILFINGCAPGSRRKEKERTVQKECFLTAVRM